MISIVSIVLLAVIIIIALVDTIPMFKDWLSRIHMGRYENKQHWTQAITNVGIKWLNATPKIKVTDNTRLVVIDMLRGNYTKHAIQHWQEAALLLGLSESIKRQDEQQIKGEIQKFLNQKFNGEGQWITKPTHIDGAILAYAVMKLAYIDVDRYKPAFDYTWELIQEHTGSDGTVEYRKFMKSYRYVDTIGFICPFLVAYGVRYGKPECVELAMRQIQTYEQYGMLESHHIPSHAYRIENKTPLGLYGWGRGLGWFAIGLIDAWNELPDEHLYKPLLRESVKRFALSAMAFQQEQGHWNWTVTRGECRPDSSTTATLGWFMLNASTIGEISEACSDSMNKAIRYLTKVTRKNGAVDFSQGDTKDIGVYSMLFNILPFTQGFCIRLMNSYNDNKAV